MIGGDERSSAKRARSSARRALDAAEARQGAALVTEESAARLLRSVQRWVVGLGVACGVSLLLALVIVEGGCR